MQKLLLIAGLTILLGSVAYLNQGQDTNFLGSRFAQFKLTHNKQYTPEEESYRQAVYLTNLALIEAHNADSTQTYQMGETQFADLTQEEFVAMYLTMRLPLGFQIKEEVEQDSNEPNDSADWRGTSAVKNQGQCGSCWAFSATGAIESFFKVKKSQTVSLSEQQLVDCDTSSYACDGGFPEKAISWAASHGLQSESAYPYKGVKQACKSSSGSTKPSGMGKVSASGLKAAVKEYPVSVAVDATNWSLYKSGTFNNCAKSLNHAVLAVGYTTGSEWIVKNSWGTGWGVSGYITLSAGDTCGVTQYAQRAV